jgi:hypothetical protein
MGISRRQRGGLIISRNPQTGKTLACSLSNACWLPPRLALRLALSRAALRLETTTDEGKNLPVHQTQRNGTNHNHIAVCSVCRVCFHPALRWRTAALGQLRLFVRNSTQAPIYVDLRCSWFCLPTYPLPTRRIPSKNSDCFACGRDVIAGSGFLGRLSAEYSPWGEKVWGGGATTREDTELVIGGDVADTEFIRRWKMTQERSITTGFGLWRLTSKVHSGECTTTSVDE